MGQFPSAASASCLATLSLVGEFKVGKAIQRPGPFYCLELDDQRHACEREVRRCKIFRHPIGTGAGLLVPACGTLVALASSRPRPPVYLAVFSLSHSVSLTLTLDSRATQHTSHQTDVSTLRFTRRLVEWCAQLSVPVRPTVPPSLHAQYLPFKKRARFTVHDNI